jgi:hypothetical protein
MAEYDDGNPPSDFDPAAELRRRLLERRHRPGMTDLDAARRSPLAPGLGLARSALNSRLAARAHSDASLAIAPGELVLPGAGDGESADLHPDPLSHPPVTRGQRVLPRRGDSNSAGPLPAVSTDAGDGVAATPLALASGRYLSDSLSEPELKAAIVKSRSEVANLQAQVNLAAKKKAIADKQSPPKSWQSRKEDDTLPGIGAALFGSFGQPTIPTTPSALFGTARSAEEVMPLVAAAAKAEPTEVTWADEAGTEPRGSAAAIVQTTAKGKAGAAGGEDDDNGKAAPGGSLDSRQIAESVSRNIYRRLQLERERKGISPWKN